MAKSQDSSFLPPPRILTHGGVFLLAFLAVLCVGSFTQAETYTNDDFTNGDVPDPISESVIFDISTTTSPSYAGVISGSGTTVTKNGEGTLSLSGANTYTGATTVTAGELIFSGSTLPVSAMTATGGTLVLGSAGNAIAAQGGSSITADGGDVRVDGNLNINSGVVTVQGDWTGNGAINVNNGGEMHVATSFSHTNEIMLNGGTLRNPTDGQNAVIESIVNVISDSYMQAADKKYTALNGVLKGSGNITIQSGTGSVNFSGDASQYTGSFNVYGIMRIGALDTDVSDSAALIGSKPITLYGGEIQNNNSDVTVTNDLILMEESYFQARYGKNLTLTGSITGDGTFHVHSSNAKNQNGWVIAATTCTDNSFTGDVWMDNDSNPYGLLKLGADNAFGTNAGTAIVWGTLDLDGHKQTFAGLYNNGNTSKGTVDSTQPGGVLTLKLNEGNSQSFGNVVKGQLSLVITGDGTGTQTLVEAPLYTGSTTIEAGTLKLTAGGTLYNLSGGSLDENGQIAVPGKLIATGNLTLNNEQMTKFIGSISATTIEKTGDGTLQLYSDADNMISAQSLVISSGRVDIKEYFKGQLEVKSGATLSPGNSVGTLEIDPLIIGESTYGGGFILNEEGATLLMEIGGQTPEENDMLIVNGPLSIDKGIIYLALADENNFTSGMDFEAQIQAGTDSDNYVDAITNALVPGWPFYNLSVTQSGNVYSIHGTYDPNAVPEPSTWALLLLGAAGLLYVRKRTRK